MICNRCNQPVPDNLVSCPACAVKGSDLGVRQYQYGPLLKIAAGRAELIIHRSKDGQAHAQMFGADVAFCGAPVATPRHKRKYIGWDEEELNKLCTKCRIELKAVLEEAREQQEQHPVER